MKKTKKAIRPNSTADWQAVKKDYLKGLSQDELVKKYGINKNTLNVHITGENWTDDRDKMVTVSNKKIIEQTAEKRTQEIMKIKIDERKSALKALDRVNDFLEQELKPYELKLLTDCQAKIQQVLYKSYGIDELKLNLAANDFENERSERLVQAHEAMQENTDKILQILFEAGALGKMDSIDAEFVVDDQPKTEEKPIPEQADHEEHSTSTRELSDDPHLIPASLRKRIKTA